MSERGRMPACLTAIAPKRGSGTGRAGLPAWEGHKDTCRGPSGRHAGLWGHTRCRLCPEGSPRVLPTLSCPTVRKGANGWTNGHISEKLPRVFSFRTVFQTLVSQILDRAEPLPPSSLSWEVITVFQYHSYFSSRGVSDLPSYLHQLAQQGGACAVETRSGALMRGGLPSYLVMVFSCVFNYGSYL